MRWLGEISFAFLGPSQLTFYHHNHIWQFGTVTVAYILPNLYRFTDKFSIFYREEIFCFTKHSSISTSCIINNFQPTSHNFRWSLTCFNLPVVSSVTSARSVLPLGPISWPRPGSLASLTVLRSWPLRPLFLAGTGPRARSPTPFPWSRAPASFPIPWPTGL